MKLEFTLRLDSYSEEIDSLLMSLFKKGRIGGFQVYASGNKVVVKWHAEMTGGEILEFLVGENND